MKRKAFFCIIILILLFSGAIYADDYKLALIDALLKNDFNTIENIIKTNIPAMSASDKRHVMNLAINYSSGENTLKACELLLSYGISPSSFDLYTAINRSRQNSTIQFLLKNGAVPNGEILLLTIQKKRFDLVKQFIEAGADVNYQYSLSRKDADGMTPLLYAVKWDNFEIVKLLVENNADVNIHAVNGDTPLSIARKNNNDVISNYLLKHGATEFIKNEVSQNNGIVNIQNNQILNLQTGAYQVSGGKKYYVLSGNTNSGTVNYVDLINNKPISGSYQITGNNLTIILSDIPLNYKIDSNESFSGNGEVWKKTKN